MTPELAQIKQHMDASGIAYRITSGQRGPRYNGDSSLHVVGRAADLAGPVPSWNSPELLAIWGYWMGVAGSIEELIYSGGTHYISRGVVKPISQLSRSLRDAHWNHVHVGVLPGWTSPSEVQVPTSDGIPTINGSVVGISAVADSDGVMTGYVILGSDGGVFAFGPGARFLGRVRAEEE